MGKFVRNTPKMSINLNKNIEVRVMPDDSFTFHCPPYSGRILDIESLYGCRLRQMQIITGKLSLVGQLPFHLSPAMLDAHIQNSHLSGLLEF